MISLAVASQAQSDRVDLHVSRGEKNVHQTRGGTSDFD
jgi:hypothetical protein